MLSIAFKLSSSEPLRLHHLSQAEQQLWNLFKKANIYKFLTGEKDCILEFQFNWISPEAPAIRWPAQANQPAQPPAAAPPPVKNQAAPQEEAPQPALPAPAIIDQASNPAEAALPPELIQPALPTPPAQQAPKIKKAQIPVSDRVLRDKQPVDYQELNTSVKRKCKSLRRKAHAVVTKLAPRAFSPKHKSPSTSGSQQ